MRILTRTVPLDFNLFLFGDDHEGSVLRHDDGWRFLVDMMNSPCFDLPPSRNLGIHHGDFIEGILVDDYRYDELTTKESFVLRQMQEAKRNFWPIRKKLLCVLDGNHPLKLRKFGEITRYFCKEHLGKEDLFGTYSAHITYQTSKGRILFRHYCAHGWGKVGSKAGDIEQQMGNIATQLKRKMKDKFADPLLCSMGHTHQLHVVRPRAPLDMYVIDGEIKAKHSPTTQAIADYSGIDLSSLPIKIEPSRRWYVNTGSFYKLYGDGVSGYAEIMGCDPIDLGFAVCLVRGGKLVDIKMVVV